MYLDNKDNFDLKLILILLLKNIIIINIDQLNLHIINLLFKKL